MRLHFLGLPHTSTTEAYAWCAFTNDVMNGATMMHKRGHEVFVYGGPANEASCTEHIPCMTELEQTATFGDDHSGLMRSDLFNEGRPWWRTFNARTILALHERLEPGDVIMAIVGKAHQAVIDAFPDTLAVEWMVGYPPERRYTRNANYTSYAWRNHCEGFAHMCFAGWQDSVIPNPFPSPGPLTARHDAGFLLFMGRKNESKGLHIANDIARRTGRRLVAAGQGPHDLAPDAFHMGVVTGADKHDLLSSAHALLVPSIYVEPFGKVVVEAQIRGVPVITSDFGAFSETIENGYNGQRCRSMPEFVAAVNAEYLPADEIARVARNRYCFDPATGNGRPGAELEGWLDRLTAPDWYSERASA